MLLNVLLMSAPYRLPKTLNAFFIFSTWMLQNNLFRIYSINFLNVFISEISFYCYPFVSFFIWIFESVPFFSEYMIQLIILDFCLLVKTALQNRRKKKVNYYFKDYRHRSIVHVNKCRCPIFHDAIKKVSKSMWFCFNYYKTLHSIELNGIQER
jgi:hypothetical protein